MGEGQNAALIVNKAEFCPLWHWTCIHY